MTDEQIVEAAKFAEKKTEFGELVHSQVSRGVNSVYGIGFLEGAEWAREQMMKEAVEADDTNVPASIRIAYRDGYEQAEKDIGWISVEDKLPGPSEWVLACIEQHGHAQCLALATYNEETKEWHTDQWEDGEQETYYPDYWMPIPNTIKK